MTCGRKITKYGFSLAYRAFSEEFRPSFYKGILLKQKAIDVSMSLLRITSLKRAINIYFYLLCSRNTKTNSASTRTSIQAL